MLGKDNWYTWTHVQVQAISQHYMFRLPLDLKHQRPKFRRHGCRHIAVYISQLQFIYVIEVPDGSVVKANVSET